MLMLIAMMLKLFCMNWKGVILAIAKDMERIALALGKERGPYLRFCQQLKAPGL